MAKTKPLKNFIFLNPFLSRFLLFLFVYLFISTFARFGFYLKFSTDTSRPLHDIWTAFVLGMRFDFSVFCYVFLIPVLLQFLIGLLPFQGILSKGLKSFHTIYLWCAFFLVFALMAIDFGFYAYFQDRINILFFGFFNDDTLALVRTFWKNYPLIWISVFAIMGGAAIWHFIRATNVAGFGYPLKRAYLFALLLTLSLGARGSFGLFPLGEMDTAISNDHFINRLSYNSVASFQRATKNFLKQNHQWNLNLKAFGYGENYLLAFQDYLGRTLTEGERQNPLQTLWRTSPHNKWAAQVKPHVVLFVMEGLSAYWLPHQSTSLNILGRFESHAKDDFLFLNFLPATGSTIGSISGLMVGMPHRPEGPFLTESNLLQVSFASAPAKVFANQGYQTEFIYGGNVSWRDIDKFAKFQGFKKVTGQPELERRLQRKVQTHDWGIFDQDVFDYVDQVLKESQTPQFLLVLTTTNHPPFELPPGYQKARQELPQQIASRMIGDSKLNEARLQTYHYSLDQLGGFMDRLKNSPLADQTVVAATGDHSFYILDFKEEELFKKWSVPFYLYLPSSQRHNVDLRQLGAHQDIPPTLYQAALDQVPYLSFGQSLLDTQRRNEALHFSRMAVNSEGGVLILNENKTSFLAWAAEGQNPFDKLVAGNESESKAQLATRYKATMGIVDYYFFESKKKGRSE